jgi:hypothetical protein
MVGTYTKLTSLGLDVFFVDLGEYNKEFIEQNLPDLKGDKKNQMLKRDISKIYEEHGRKESIKAVKNIKRLDLSMQVTKKLGK